MANLQASLGSILQPVPRSFISSVPDMQPCTRQLLRLKVDVNIAAGKEYRSMFEQLRADDLPRFEGRFKDQGSK
ncbi:MAG: hypothetical protein WCI64_07765 [Chlorobium sp.]